MVAIFGLSLLKVTDWLVAFVGLTVATNEKVPPLLIDTLVLFKETDVEEIVFTVTVTLALIPFRFVVAVIVACPGAIPLTTPFASTVAILVLLLWNSTALKVALLGVIIGFKVTVWFTPIE